MPMDSYNSPDKYSYADLLAVLTKRRLDESDQYRRVYIISLIQRLEVLISQQRRNCMKFDGA